MNEIENIVNQLIETYKNNLRKSSHVASGDLINNIASKIEFNNDTYQIALVMPEQWRYLEYGTRPHFPPVDAIRSWIRIKKILPRPLKNGKLPTTNQLAYLIGRKISREGTQATHLLERSMNEIDFKKNLLDSIFEVYDMKIREALNPNQQ